MKITSLAYSRPEDDPKKKNPNRIAPSPSPLGVAALATGGGGSSSGSGGITIGTTTVTSGTAGRVLYTTAGNVVGSAPIEVNALSSTYLTVTSGAAAAGVVVGVAGGGANENIILTPKGSGVVEQRNSTTAQTLRIYSTFTDASNYLRTEISGNAIINRNAGTSGAATFYIVNIGNAPLSFQTQNIDRWQILGTGHFVAPTDNTYDIGASGATRPRNVYVANDLVVSNSITTSGSLGIIFAAGSSRIGADAGNGTLVLQNNAKTDFSRLQFGGTTSSFPAIKRNGAALDLRLADDSGYASLVLSNLTVQGTIMGFGSSTTLRNSGDGVLLITDSTAAALNRVQFGGTTSSFPALKRSSTSIAVRLADDSDDAPLTTLTVKTKALTVGTLPAAATAGAGARAFVTDANATTFLSTVAGGGANAVPVVSDGTNWLIG